MRPIKFRVWNPIRKMMGLTDWPCLTLNGWPFANEQAFGLEPMQYTGLHDKNGTEIFEGDLVKPFETFGRDEVQAVVWGDEFPGFLLVVAKNQASVTHSLTADTAKDCEIIGNIHENPELVK